MQNIYTELKIECGKKQGTRILRGATDKNRFHIYTIGIVLSCVIWSCKCLSIIYKCVQQSE